MHLKGYSVVHIVDISQYVRHHHLHIRLQDDIQYYVLIFYHNVQYANTNHSNQ